MNADYVVRPMTLDDTHAVERLSDAAFYDLDVRTHRPGWPEPEHRAPERAESWRSRIRAPGPARPARLLGGRGRRRRDRRRGQHAARPDLAARDFIVNVCIDGKRQVTWLGAGDMIKAWEEGVRSARRRQGRRPGAARRRGDELRGLPARHDVVSGGEGPDRGAADRASRAARSCWPRA